MDSLWFWILLLFIVAMVSRRRRAAEEQGGGVRRPLPDAGRTPAGHPSTWSWPEEESQGRRRAEPPREVEQLVFEGGQVRTAAEMRAEVDEAKQQVKERWRAEQRRRRVADQQHYESERAPAAAAEPEEIPSIVYAVEHSTPPVEPAEAPAAEPSFTTAPTVFTNPVPIAMEERLRPAPAPAPIRPERHTRPWDAARERAAARRAAFLAQARARHAAMLAEMRARHERAA